MILYVFSVLFLFLGIVQKVHFVRFWFRRFRFRVRFRQFRFQKRPVSGFRFGSIPAGSYGRQFRSDGSSFDQKFEFLEIHQKSKQVNNSIPNQKITSPHHPKSKNNIAHPAKKRGGDPWGPKGPQPSLFGGVVRCYSLIWDDGGM